MILEIFRLNVKVAEIENNKTVYFNDAAPILIKQGRFEDWVNIRKPDINRPNVRSLRRMMGLSTSRLDDVFGEISYQSLSDSFWLRQKGAVQTWESIQFQEKDGCFFEHALSGKMNFDSPDIYKSRKSPEHTNIGSFEKGWKNVAPNKWQLWKSGDNSAVWSEVFYSNLANEIFPNIAVKYWEEDGYSVCDNFVDRCKGDSLEPIFSLIDEHNDPEDVLKVLPEALHEDYRRMLFLDALMFNWDRHEFNFGITTDIDGNIKGLTPLFDFNLSLFNGASPNSKRFEDTTIQMFKAIKGTEEYPVAQSMVENAYKNTKTSFEAVATLNETADFIMQGYGLVYFL
ncbi:MAG: hypothetical protein FWB74_09840 [Defluviitaleaceae bacterium]|nr:hypothetical protein [Defluviitaleaceae bacterium]